MILLPEDEEILDVVCGDKDFWVISATHNIAHVKPAKEGAATNLNLVTGTGTVYSFLLSEKSGNTTPDLKIYVAADPTEPLAKPRTTPLHNSRRFRPNCRRRETRWRRNAVAWQTRSSAISRTTPRNYSSSTAHRIYDKPFLVRAIWNDGQFT